MTAAMDAKVDTAVSRVQAAFRGHLTRAAIRSAAPPHPSIVWLAPLHRTVFAIVIMDRRTLAEYKGGLEPGCKAELHGLQGRSDLNGATGIVHEWIPDVGRWAVQCDGEGGFVRVKADNLISLGRPPEPTKKAKGAKQRQAQKAQAAKTEKQTRKTRNYKVCADGTVLDFGLSASAPSPFRPKAMIAFWENRPKTGHG